MSKSAPKPPKRLTRHSPGLHPKAAKAASYNRDTAHRPSSKHESEIGAEEPLPSIRRVSMG
eukprot:1228955-Prymnesium_polylepis.1